MTVFWKIAHSLYKVGGVLIPLARIFEFVNYGYAQMLFRLKLRLDQVQSFGIEDLAAQFIIR